MVCRKNNPALPRPTLAGVVNTTVTDWNGTPTLLNDTGNVTQTLASLARNSGETVTAPGPTYAITREGKNARRDSGDDNYSYAGALSMANSPTPTITTAPVTSTLTTPGQPKSNVSTDTTLFRSTLAGVVNTTVTDWNGTPTLLNDTGNVTQTLASLARNSGETVTAPGPTYAITRERKSVV